MNNAEGKIGEEKSRGISGRGVKGRRRDRERQAQDRACSKKKLQAQPTLTPANLMQYHIHYHVFLQTIQKNCQMEEITQIISLG